MDKTKSKNNVSDNPITLTEQELNGFLYTVVKLPNYVIIGIGKTPLSAFRDAKNTILSYEDSTNHNYNKKLFDKDFLLMRISPQAYNVVEKIGFTEFTKVFPLSTPLVDNRGVIVDKVIYNDYNHVENDTGINLEELVDIYEEDIEKENIEREKYTKIRKSKSPIDASNWKFAVVETKNGYINSNTRGQEIMVYAVGDTPREAWFNYCDKSNKPFWKNKTKLLKNLTIIPIEPSACEFFSEFEEQGSLLYVNELTNIIPIDNGFGEIITDGIVLQDIECVSEIKKEYNEYAEHYENLYKFTAKNIIVNILLNKY